MEKIVPENTKITTFHPSPLITMLNLTKKIGFSTLYTGRGEKYLVFQLVRNIFSIIVVQELNIG